MVVDQGEHISIRSHIVHAHGEITKDYIRIPSNVFVFMLCEIGSLTMNEPATIASWHFKGLQLHRDLLNIKISNAEHLIRNYLDLLHSIMDLDHNQMCVLNDCHVNNMKFTTDNNDFESLIVNFPYVAKAKALQNQIESIDPSQVHLDGSKISNNVHPKGTKLLTPTDDYRIDIKHAPTLHDVIMTITSNSDPETFHFLIVATCTSNILNVPVYPIISSKTKEPINILPIHYNQEALSYILRQMSSHLTMGKNQIQASEEDANALIESIHTMRIGTEKRKEFFTTICPAKRVRVFGGSPKTSYKIHVERNTQRRYVLRSKQKWYLDENRGRYNYVDPRDKTHITIKST